MLRSVFLAFSPDHFFTLVQGSLQLLDPSSPDSMNMLPDHIAVIDLGNFILIRAGMDVDDEGMLDEK
jgi:hypothetical protein